MKNKILILPLILIALLFSCENPSTKKVDLKPVKTFGSLTVGDGGQSRALQVDKILGAKRILINENPQFLKRLRSACTGLYFVQGVQIERGKFGEITSFFLAVFLV